LINNAIGFLIGLSSLFWLQSSQQSVVLLAFSFFSLLLLFFIKKLRYQTPVFSRAVFFGFLWASLSVIIWTYNTSKLLTEPKVTTMQGYICSLTTPSVLSIDKIQTNKPQNSKRLSFDFCLTKLSQQKISFYQNNKIKLSVYHPSALQVKTMQAGSYWNLTAKIKPIHGRLNPGGFDYEKWLISEGFIGTGYIKQSKAGEKSFSFKSYYHAVRQKIFNQLNHVIKDSPNKGMILALAIGERSSITQQQWQVIKDSGTSHLLAISGLHIGIAAFWTYLITLFFCRRIKKLTDIIPAQKIAQIMSLVGALAIALISGFNYPAQRALIMLVIFVYSRHTARHLSLANILSLSVIVITLIQPFAILTISFWLSVIAVAIIVFLLSYHSTNDPEELQKNFLKRFKYWLRINWYLFLGLIPITWVVFDSISMVSYGANLILIPLTSFITTPLVYIGLILLSLSQVLAAITFQLVEFLIALTYQIQYFFFDINQAVSVKSLPLLLFFLLAISVLLIITPSKTPGKYLLLPITALFWFVLNQTNNPKLKILVFDIGQGLAIHLAINNKNILYDTGYGNKQFSMAKKEILPYFKREGIETLDMLILSHADADHSGGYKAINETIKIEQLLVGEKINNKRIKQFQQICHYKKKWLWEGVEFSFLPHLITLKENISSDIKGNNASCVLKIKSVNKTILITGDIEKRAERELIKNKLGKINLLIAPHHGSLTSSTEDFVSHTSAKTVIFSTGYANQWEFPKAKVVQRYSDHGAEIYITHQDGAITIQQDPKGNFNSQTQRNKNKHFWQLKQYKLSD